MTINLPTERFKSADRLQITAAAAIVAGTPQEMLGDLIGIPVNDIANGDIDELDISGRFRAWGVASQAWVVGEQIGWDADGDPLNGTAGDGAYTNVEANWDFPVGSCVEAKGSSDEMGVILINVYLEGSAPWIPASAQQTLAAGGGAVTVTEFYTAGASDAGGDAWTMADGLKIGQLKKVQLITDGGGDATLTPTTLSGGTTITFADAGDYALLQWTANGWLAIELGNDADGATAPVLA
jgi:predicted RecA/RadA family phage recombinase